MPVNTNLGPGPLNTNLGPGPVNANSGPGTKQRAGGGGPQTCNLIKKETPAQVFSREFFEISKSTFFTEHL